MNNAVSDNGFMFGTGGLQGFIESCWPDKNYHVLHAQLDDVLSFLSLPGSFSVDTVLQDYKSPVMCYGKKLLESTEGLSDRLMVNANKAAKLYAEGAALEFDFADLAYEKLYKIGKKLKKNLLLPNNVFHKAIIYAAHKQGGLVPHFDSYVNFVFQIQGEKKWYFMPNENALRPLEHLDLKDYPHLSAEMQQYWQGEPPTNFFEQATEVVLKPGSVLFVPRGWWHATRSDVETLAVNLTYSVPTKVEVILDALKKEMVKDPALREYITSEDVYHPEQINESVILATKNLTADSYQSSYADVFDNYQALNYAIRKYMSYLS
ncbi:cupin-like domain-containing protein [Rahnella sp. C60]|uniref:JmjC domain-containing protein n=1 Tax=Rahnella perminowiae TaxID=2816244 RepID=UPI001C25FF98|nr:cupin domain-containing protein [Rahnella perminowiae]MBU9808423.1 cupin-like domain-containing protein [Rahnella perminowiae]MBU9813490.1 cupin-like domain-containing protein [Rahnella perminowiae]MCX2944383.1 cupin-like domain-containing protein [Rahnella perminowiae]